MKCPATDCSIQLVRKRRIIYNNDWNKLKPSSRTIYVVYIYKTRTSRFFSFFFNKISLSNIKLLIFIYNQKTAISSFWRGEKAQHAKKKLHQSSCHFVSPARKYIQKTDYAKDGSVERCMESFSYIFF